MCFGLGVLALGALALSAGLGCRRGGATRSSVEELARDPTRARAALQELEWRRADPDHLVERLLRHADASLRTRAALAGGRAGLLGLAPKLLERLADPAPAVRREAAFALRLLLLDAPPGRPEPRLAHTVHQALVARLAVEKDPAAREAVILSLGWLGDAEAVVRLGRELETSDAAIAAWGILGQRGKLETRLVGPLLAVLERGAPPRRRLATWALGRIPGSASPAYVASLLRAGEGGDPLVRALATRVVGEKGGPGTIPWLAKRLADPEPLVQVEAARALGRLGPRGAPRLIEGARAIWEVVSSGHFRLTGPRLGALLAILEALRSHAEKHEVQQLAKELLESADASKSSVAYSPIEAHAVDLAHCAAAYLVDLAAGRPEETSTCGTAHAPSLSRSFRRAQVARLLGDLDRDTSYKVTSLRRYLHDEAPAVRTAAAEALARLTFPAAQLAFEEALKDPDPPTAAQAAIALRRHAGRLSTELPLFELLLRRLDQLNVAREPEAACAFVETLETFKLTRGVPLLGRLLRSPSWAVKSCAARALGTLRAPLEPEGPALSSGLPELRWAEARSLPRRAVLVVAKGEVHLELDPERAPATVANFARLAQRGFYRGTPFHRIVPGFVVQGGDPRGDGWGGPGYTIPCELSSAPFVAGSLGMALAGRDTAGSQFFVALGRQPHLDGRYTHFGRVVRGMEVIERLQPGEPIQDLYIPTAETAAPRDGKH